MTENPQIVHTFIGSLGHLFVITSFIAAVFAAFSFYKGSQLTDPEKKAQWAANGRISFYIHAVSVFGIVASLFYIIYNHYFEYHYAWSHSSLRLPTHYMISSFWEGQEGSFLLWIFWHAVIGIVLIRTNKNWQAPVMTIFALVQGFLTSMILGVVIFNFKLGSTPFILLRDVMVDAPIFQTDPNFVPADGTGLNPLLQNYWMVIHPPTLFLGFATTLIPFAFCIAGLWQNKFKEWIRPALPWALFSAAVLGLGILMGGYWAYETLNFGGYWNWDPVENAVYVPWLFLIAAIHTMITFKNSSTALKSSIILVITTFVLILYSTFLVRSGILGESSVHSFTDLGLAGQLLTYLLFFTIGAIVLAIIKWKQIPTTQKEVSSYSREFWIFIGATTLGLMGFQVLIPTSFPVFNEIGEFFGASPRLALPADQVEYFGTWQKWFAVAVAFLSGTGQFFWWQKIDRSKLWQELTIPIILTLVVGAVLIQISGVTNLSYLILMTAGVYSIIANGKILIRVARSNVNLSGGSIAHISIAMILIGIMFSSGYSTVVSKNQTGSIIHPDLSNEINLENVLLFLNETKQMGEYQVNYRGQRIEVSGFPGFVNKNELRLTADPNLVVTKSDISWKGLKYYSKGDTLEILPENTYYEVEYTDAKGRSFRLYPRAQINEDMGGILASPDIKRGTFADLYTHVSSIPDPTQETEWSDPEEVTIGLNERFFVNDYVASVESIVRIYEAENVTIGPDDVAVKASIRVLGDVGEYLAEPIYIIRDRLMLGRIPDEIPDLGVRFALLHIHPEDDNFTLATYTTEKDYIILKAMEKPFINVLWIGTLLLMVGFGVAIKRRYVEFVQTRDKEAA